MLKVLPNNELAIHLELRLLQKREKQPRGAYEEDQHSQTEHMQYRGTKTDIKKVVHVQLYTQNKHMMRIY